MTTEQEIASCDREIAHVTKLLRAGHPEDFGLFLALQDWRAERRLLTGSYGSTIEKTKGDKLLSINASREVKEVEASGPGNSGPATSPVRSKVRSVRATKPSRFCVCCNVRWHQCSCPTVFRDGCGQCVNHCHCDQCRKSREGK